MSNTELSSCQSLFLNEQFSDVIIKVINRKDGYTWSYPAHSLILNAGSEILKERIESNTEDDKKLLTFVDLEPETVLLVLRFLYFGELPPVRSEVNLLHLLGAAHKLRIRPLQEECQNRLLRCIRVDNACRLLEIASNQCALGYGDTIIVQACQRVVLDYCHIIFSSDLVLYLSKSTLDIILQTSKLNVLDESVIFDGLWRWGTMGCCKTGAELTVETIADYLGNLLGHIRYAFLSSTDTIPQLVKDRFINCKSSCCFATDNSSKTNSRRRYRQPVDLLRHCNRIDTSVYSTRPTDDISDVTSLLRVLCAQFSFDGDVFLAAVALEANHSEAQLSEADTFVLSIAAEDTGLEISRQEIFWDENYSSNPKNSSTPVYTTTAIVRLPAPVCIRRGLVHSVRLLRKAKTSTAVNCTKWTFKTRQIDRRTVPVDQFLHMTAHTDYLVALTSLFLFPRISIA